jgi:hypothetical protein
LAQKVLSTGSINLKSYKIGLALNNSTWHFIKSPKQIKLRTKGLTQLSDTYGWQGIVPGHSNSLFRLEKTMAPKFEHFMDEADIGSGEKTPTEMEDLEKTEHLREQQEQARQQARPMDGALLQQVVEEQEYINQHESHTPHSVMDSPSGDQETPNNRDIEEVAGVSPIPPEQKSAVSAPSQGQPRH